MTDLADDTERLGIQSVEVAAEILQALAGGGGQMPLRDIAAATGMHRGKVHRYLISLTRTGLVSQDSATGQYAIGPLALAVGLAALRRIDPLRAAQAVLPELRAQANETVVLAIWGDMGATVIALEESAWPVTLNVRVGSVLPLAASAVGQVFAAYLQPGILAPVLKRERGSKPAALPASLQPADLAQVRRRGIARVQGSLLPGLNAMAAPVFEHRGKLSSVLGLVGRQESLDVGWNSPAAAALRTSAERLSTELGFKPGSSNPADG